VVLVEGNYLLNFQDRSYPDGPEWARLEPLWDERWFVECRDPAEQRARLVRRHAEMWTAEKVKLFGAGEEGAGRKADANDVPNARAVDAHKDRAGRVIVSLS
jgi:pantothenate kinase